MEITEGLEILQGSIKQPRQEVSLKTLKKKEKEKIMAAYKRSRDSAEKFYQGSIEPSLIRRKKIYDAPKEFFRKKFPKISELSDWISRDVKTTIDWMLPSIMEVFIGTDDPCDIKGQSLQDDVAAKKLQSIVKYQINKKNDYFRFLYSFIKEGLITNLGVAKVYWERDETRNEMEVMVDSSNLDQFLQLEQMGKIEIKEMTIIDGLAAIIKYDEIKTHFNNPVIENMSPSELRFTPDGHTLAESKFVAQRKMVKGSYLKSKELEGVFQDVDKAIKEADDRKRTGYDQYTNKYFDSYGNFLNDDDNASKDLVLYEAYLDVDYNNDGILEKVIVHAVGDVPIAIQENTFRSVPFFIFAPEPDPYIPYGETSYADTLEQLQDLKTVLIRQVIIAVAKNNRPQMFVAEHKVDTDALIDGDELIPVRDGSPAEAVMYSPHIPLDPITMTLVQYAQNDIESQSGSTRYNQGLDSNSLNKTASGINAVMGAADKKMKLIARIFAECAWVPIIKHIIKLDQQFLDPYQQFRLNDEMVNISPEELDIDYDLVVNTGQGAATKEAQMNYLIMIMQQLYPALQNMGVATEKSWYETAKDLLEKMGIRNVQNYLIDPDSDQWKQAQVQKQQAAEQAEQKQLDTMLMLQKVKLESELQRQSIPRMNMTSNYKDLPVEAKQSYIDQYLKERVPEPDIWVKELMDVLGGSYAKRNSTLPNGAKEREPRQGQESGAGRGTVSNVIRTQS
nr:MAG TPA: Portal protein [Caudoviricetes sp.]